MRVYRPTYSVPVPPKAKRLKRKDGVYVRFTTKRGQEVTAKLSKSGKRAVMETSTFTVEFRDGDDHLRRLPAFTDESASNRLGTTIQDLLNCIGSGQGVPVDLRKRLETLPAKMQRSLADWGLLDAKANMASKPLPELIELYQHNLADKGRSREYVIKTPREARTVFDACGFRHLSQINADEINKYLSRRRAKDGISYRRSNALLISCKGFCNWAVESGLITQSPLQGKRATLLDVRKDRRRVRRALELDELRRLFEAAETSEVVTFGLTGPERALLYRVAAETGIRRGELSQLVVSDFNLDSHTATVPAKAAKNGKERTVPLSPKMAARLGQHFANNNKLPTASWLRVPDHTAIMIRTDLDAAGIPYKDDRGHVFDFHSLRGECATSLVESGVDVKVAQEILGHSDIKLTLSIYAKTLDEKAKKQAAAQSISDLIEKAG